MEGSNSRVKVPRSKDNDYTPEAAETRRAFVRNQTGAALDHVGGFTFDPAILPGNVENFTGVAQMPVGIAGPLKINGEHADGEFYIPLATTEGTLVASYSRGMRLLTESGGVTTTVVEEYMNRSPVFIFDSARQARDFGLWLDENMDGVRAAAESTSSIAKLVKIDKYAVGPMLYCRINYTTGDAAGQNMVTKASFVACHWIKQHYPKDLNFIMSGNIDTDKKHSQLNMLNTRGKRVIAEAVIKKEVMQDLMGVDTADLFRQRQISMTGAFMVGSAFNGAHSANGLASLFIATGQDEANTVESHAGMAYSNLLPNGDYYWSVTLPSLIVATYGGGTGLATQKECLEMLGCYGKGKARKFAEICAATVLAGETSLSSAVLAGDWVTSHDELGRNRP